MGKKKMSMATYRKEHYIGGMTENGVRKYNEEADEKLAKSPNSYVYYNADFRKSVRWLKNEYNGVYRVGKQRLRGIPELLAIAEMRLQSLKDKGWLENVLNPTNNPYTNSTPNRIASLSQRVKLVK